MKVRHHLSVLMLGLVCAAAAVGCNKPAETGSTNTAPAVGGVPAVEEVKGAASGSAAAPAE